MTPLGDEISHTVAVACNRSASSRDAVDSAPSDGARDIARTDHAEPGRSDRFVERGLKHRIRAGEHDRFRDRLCHHCTRYQHDYRREHDPQDSPHRTRNEIARPSGSVLRSKLYEARERVVCRSGPVPRVHARCHRATGLGRGCAHRSRRDRGRAVAAAAGSKAPTCFASSTRTMAGSYEIELREQQIRDIAAATSARSMRCRSNPNTRVARGEALLVWGEYDDDALRIRTLGDLALALDTLQAISASSRSRSGCGTPPTINSCACSTGSTARCTSSRRSTATAPSVGDPTRDEMFELTDHDMGTVSVRWADFVPWRTGRPALLRFVEYGELGDNVILDGTIPSQLLMLGDFDREAELESRRLPPVEPVKSSLPDKAPQGMWARRLVASLVDRQLIELDDSILKAIIARVTLLLVQHGQDAQDSPDVATQLAKEISTRARRRCPVRDRWRSADRAPPHARAARPSRSRFPAKGSGARRTARMLRSRPPPGGSASSCPSGLRGA